MATPAPSLVAAAPPPARVFVSYTTSDLATAKWLVAFLEARGIRCWFAPREIEISDSWAAAIPLAIASCRALVVLVTSAACESPFVQREVEMVVSARRPLLPVLVGAPALTPAMQFLLGSKQCLSVPPGIGEDAAGQILDKLRELSAPPDEAMPPADARQVAAAISKPSDATLWRVYASTRATLVLWMFYGLSMALPQIVPKLPLSIQEQVELATKGLAFAAGLAVVAVTRRANLPVLFTIGFVQPVFMLLPTALRAPELAWLSLASAPPLEYGGLCAAGGFVMALRFGLPRLSVLSMRVWRAWIYPAWSVLKRSERLVSVLRIVVVLLALGLLAFSLAPQ